MPALTFVCVGFAAGVTPGTKRVQSQVSTPRLQAIRFWSFSDVTRIAIQTEGSYRLTTDHIEKPYRLYFDLSGLRPPPNARRGIQTIHVEDPRLKQIRIAEVSPGKTRVVFDLAGPVEMVSSQLVNPDRLMIELRPKRTSTMASVATGRSGAVQPALPRYIVPRALIALESTPPQAALVLADLPSYTPLTAKEDGPRRSGFVTNSTALKSVHPLPVPATLTGRSGVAPAAQSKNSDPSLVRVFGLKLGKVVIDAGHGGHDTGTIGPNGLMEKDLVLDVALRLGRLITDRLGADVVLTRANDTFLPLEERTRVANKERADLFLSIHANSSPEPTATGVETYFFNFTSDHHSVDLATRENAASTSSIADLGDLLHRAVLQAKLSESREFAQQVQSSLWASSVKINNRSKDRGVRQAPFVVLIGATMPSILAEIGFVSNPHDEQSLRTGESRQRIAEALYKGISQYASSLSHSQLARAGS